MMPSLSPLSTCLTGLAGSSAAAMSSADKDADISMFENLVLANALRLLPDSGTGVDPFASQETMPSSLGAATGADAATHADTGQQSDDDDGGADTLPDAWLEMLGLDLGVGSGQALPVASPLTPLTAPPPTPAESAPLAAASTPLPKAPRSTVPMHLAMTVAQTEPSMATALSDPHAAHDRRHPAAGQMQVPGMDATRPAPAMVPAPNGQTLQLTTQAAEPPLSAPSAGLAQSPAAAMPAPRSEMGDVVPPQITIAQKSPTASGPDTPIAVTPTPIPTARQTEAETLYPDPHPASAKAPTPARMMAPAQAPDGLEAALPPEATAPLDPPGDVRPAPFVDSPISVIAAGRSAILPPAPKSALDGQGPKDNGPRPGDHDLLTRAAALPLLDKQVAGEREAPDIDADADIGTYAATGLATPMLPMGTKAVATAMADTPLPDMRPAPLDLSADLAFLDRLSTDINAVARDGGKLHFRLAPAHLGRLDVAVETQGDNVAVHMQTQSPEAKSILIDAQSGLTQDLAARGLRLAETTVTLAGDGNSPRRNPSPPAQLIEVESRREADASSPAAARPAGRFA